MPSKVHPKNPQLLRNVVIEDRFCKGSVTALTVWKKSLMFNCNGFTVYNETGNLAFRVDNYDSQPNNEVLLMDAAGNVLLTLKRKRLSLLNEWQAFLGDKSRGQKPLFTVRRASLFSAKALVEVFVGVGSDEQNRCPDFKIEGSYAKRLCTVYNSYGDVIFEMKRKQATSEITLGGDVFSVIVQPGYDEAFVMGLIVILDQIVSCDGVGEGINSRLLRRTLSLELPHYFHKKQVVGKKVRSLSKSG